MSTFWLFVRDTEMAVDAGSLSGSQALVLLLGCFALFLGIHGLDIMTIPAFPRIAYFHALPNAFGQFQAVLLKFFPGIDGTHEMVPNIVGCLELADHRIDEFMRYMAIGTGGLDAGPVHGVDRMTVLLEVVVLHLMTGSTEFDGIRLFK